MLNRNLLILISVLFFIPSCKNAQNPVSETKAPKVNKKKQEKIIEEHLEKGAYTHHYFSQDYQDEIDKGLAKDSTIAYLWQQKAMPMFKQGKHEAGMKLLDKAVKYDPLRWLEYRAFIKCIFARTYTDAIADFEVCKANYPGSYVMDHSHDFYIGLSYLQLNEFKKAEKIFEIDNIKKAKEVGRDGVHHVDLFYYGISKYENRKYEHAIALFDWALEIYPEFSDAMYYKAIALDRLGNREKGRAVMKEAKINGKNGDSINEDNAIWERYPYQVRWEHQ